MDLFSVITIAAEETVNQTATSNTFWNATDIIVTIIGCIITAIVTWKAAKANANKKALSYSLKIYPILNKKLQQQDSTSLNDIIITNDAKIDLCCLDWKREHCFGDLKKQSIKQIIKETEIYNIFLNLASGKRENIICKNCLKSHTKNILDFNFNGITYINKN